MREVGDQAQLVALDGLGYRVAFPYRSKAALGRQSEPLAREVTGRFFDPPHNCFGRFELDALGRDESEHDALVGRDVAQRLERTRAPVVILQEPEREIGGAPEGLP